MLDLAFPPFCLACEEGKTNCRYKWFCPACWELLAFLDPASRCRHCFEEIGGGFLCLNCLRKPLLCFPCLWLLDPSPAASILRKNIEEIEEALASMAWMFWQTLNRNRPDRVIAIPEENGGRAIFRIAKYLAKLFDRPFIKGLKRSYSGYLQPDILLSSSLNAATQEMLLLVDAGSSLSWLQKSAEKIGDLFPKKVVILSLFKKI